MESKKALQQSVGKTDFRDEHDFDEDAVCRKCGFDGAEWHWWKHSTYEGRAQPEAKQPPCKDRQRGE